MFTWCKLKLNGFCKNTVDIKEKFLSDRALEESVGWLAETSKNNCGKWKAWQIVAFSWVVKKVYTMDCMHK